MSAVQCRRAGRGHPRCHPPAALRRRPRRLCRLLLRRLRHPVRRLLPPLFAHVMVRCLLTSWCGRAGTRLRPAPRCRARTSLATLPSCWPRPRTLPSSRSRHSSPYVYAPPVSILPLRRFPALTVGCGLWLGQLGAHAAGAGRPRHGVRGRAVHRHPQLLLRLGLDPRLPGAGLAGLLLRPQVNAARNAPALNS